MQFPNYPVEVPRKDLTFDFYDRQGTENLIAEAERAGVEQFFYMSGASADPAAPEPWYRAKGRAEKRLRSSRSPPRHPATVVGLWSRGQGPQ